MKVAKQETNLPVSKHLCRSHRQLDYNKMDFTFLFHLCRRRLQESACEQAGLDHKTSHDILTLVDAIFQRHDFEQQSHWLKDLSTITVINRNLHKIASKISMPILCAMSPTHYTIDSSPMTQVKAPRKITSLCANHRFYLRKSKEHQKGSRNLVSSIPTTTLHIINMTQYATHTRGRNRVYPNISSPLIKSVGSEHCIPLVFTGPLLTKQLRRGAVPSAVQPAW